MKHEEKYLLPKETLTIHRSRSAQSPDHQKLIFIFLTTVTLLFICVWSLDGWSYTTLNYHFQKLKNFSLISDYEPAPPYFHFTPSSSVPTQLFITHQRSTSSSMIIDKNPTPCSNSTHLLVICFTAPGNFAARSAVRDTWGLLARNLGAYFYFLIGRTDDQAVQDQIYEEDSVYQDIIQADFTDTYYNLTQKSIQMMRWIAEWNCTETLRFVFKVDDDMLVNMAQIFNYTKNLVDVHKTFIGRLAHKWQPFRNPKDKYYVSKEAYPGRFYPDFVTGPAYLFTTDLARPLYDAASTDDPTKVLYFEDVYMSGILGERLGITRLNHTSIINQPIFTLRVTKKNFDTVWTSHMYEPKVLRDKWKDLYVLPKECVEFCDL